MRRDDPFQMRRDINQLAADIRVTHRVAKGARGVADEANARTWHHRSWLELLSVLVALLVLVEVVRLVLVYVEN